MVCYKDYTYGCIDSYERIMSSMNVRLNLLQIAQELTERHHSKPCAYHPTFSQQTQN